MKFRHVYIPGNLEMHTKKMASFGSSLKKVYKGWNPWDSRAISFSYDTPHDATGFLKDR